jgi:predicted deacylase
VGIPAIIYEAGEPMRLQEHEIGRGIAGVRNTLIWLGMLDGERRAASEPSMYHHSYWVRADAGGILITETTLGQFVEEGELLGIITDPVRKERAYVNTAHRGRVIGMTLAPMMIPGSAAFHIGVDDGESLVHVDPTPKSAPAPAVGDWEELGGAEEERPE